MTQRPVLSVDDRGSGPPLVFIHGFLNDKGVWSGVVDALEGDFRCLSVDLPGHGDSPPVEPGGYGRADVLDDLRRVFARAGIERAILVGHSLGGYLSLALAIEDADRVAGLGLVGAGPGFRNPASLERWNESVHTLVADRDLPPGMEAISMHVDSMVMDHLAEITAPAAVIVGERDTRFMASADVFDKYLHVIDRTVVPGAGHMVHRKAPAQVAAALRAAFASPGER